MASAHNLITARVSRGVLRHRVFAMESVLSRNPKVGLVI